MFLLLDNYDSFTYNLRHYLGELGAEVEVRRNDAISADEALALGAEGIVDSANQLYLIGSKIVLPEEPQKWSLFSDGHLNIHPIFNVAAFHSVAFFPPHFREELFPGWE